MVNEVEPLEVLVADDDLAVRDILKDLITPYGAKVTDVSGGLEAIRAYVARVNGKNPDSGKHFDLVFTDLNMPNVKGHQVTKAIKALSKNLPQERLPHPTYVCVVTGIEATEEYRDMEVKLGEFKPDYMLQKPFGVEKIFGIMDDVKQRIRDYKSQQLPPQS